MARAYRKRPVVVEAVQWTGNNHADMCEFIDPEGFEIIPRVGLVIHTLEGDHHASPGDYIIKGVSGEFYPCKPDIFAKTYEAVFPTLTPPNEAPPCYQPDGDGCAYQCYDGQDEPIAKCKECPLCYSDKQRHHTPPNKWVAVEERLPEYNPSEGAKSYWIAKKDCYGNWQMKLAQFCDYGYAMTVDAETEVTWRDWDFTKIVGVTHWMLLPAPPDRRPPEGEADA